jgi:hypothetical protein
MQYVAPILQALSSIAWPAFAFFAAIIFRKDITIALGRMKKGKFLGQEFELDDDLRKLEISATTTAKEIELLPPDEAGMMGPIEEESSAIDAILRHAASSPKTALMLLQAELERQARHALAIRGLLNGRNNIPFRQALAELREYGFPSYLGDALSLFSDIRNKIIHGHSASDDDALKAIDSGITILKALSALPAETKTVYHPGVDIFSDASCEHKILEAKGIILETVSVDGSETALLIYPTTKSYFRRGKKVSWEWNLSRVWQNAWYRDPESGDIKQAWSQSAEFVGRHLDDI